MSDADRTPKREMSGDGEDLPSTRRRLAAAIHKQHGREDARLKDELKIEPEAALGYDEPVG
eukprot:3591566-Alexandrium_andersonii.AAC.1